MQICSFRFVVGNVCTTRFVVSDSPDNLSGRGGQTEMITEPKRKPHQNDCGRDKRERSYREEALDDALKNTFPASDPVSIVQPTPPAAARDRAKT